MILPDVNVLVYAYRRDAAEHERYRAWLVEAVGGDAGFGMSELVLSGFVHIVTHPRAFLEPTPPDRALAFAEVLRSRPNCDIVRPGLRHWDIYVRLCREGNARGNLAFRRVPCGARDRVRVGQRPRPPTKRASPTQPDKERRRPSHKILNSGVRGE